MTNKRKQYNKYIRLHTQLYYIHYELIIPLYEYKVDLFAQKLLHTFYIYFFISHFTIKSELLLKRRTFVTLITNILITTQ